MRRVRKLIVPADRATNGSQDHSTERSRKAMLTGGAATLARVVQISTSLITVPLTLKYLGNERFGLWMTISSVLAMAAFADFGVGNGVLNTVAKAFGEDDVPGIRKAVSSGFALLNSIAVLLLMAFFSIYRFVNWGEFFRVSTQQAKSEAGPALAVFAVCFALNISMDVVQRVQLGLQQGYRYGLWQLCGSTLGFVGVLAGIRLHVTLPYLVVAIAGAPIAATALNALHFFGSVRPDLRPTMHLVSKTTLLDIAKIGSMFFVLQVVVAVSYSADNFIIARSIGAINVPEYSIPQRMFSLISMMSAMLLTGLWPAYGEAISRGHIVWVRRTLRRSLLIVFFGGSIASVTLLILSHQLLQWWVGSRIHPSFLLLAGLATWCVYDCCCNALAMFLNGAAAMRYQVFATSAFGIVCLGAKVMFVRRYGIALIPWATIISCTFVAVIPWCLYVPRLLKTLESNALAGNVSSAPINSPVL